MTPMLGIREKPFGGTTRVKPIDTLSRAPSIYELLAEERDLPMVFIECCEARINGALVPRSMWKHVRLRPQVMFDISVTFTMPLHNKTWRTIATIGVLLVAAAFTLGLAAPLLGGLATATAISAGTLGTVIGATIAIGGQLAIAALTPPPNMPDQSSLFGGASSGSSGTGEVSGDLASASAASLNGNVLGRGQAIPRVIGTMRIYPPLLVQPLVEIIGEHTIAEAVYGLCGPHAISDIQVGTTDSELLPDLTTEIQEGLPNSQQQGLVTRQGFTDTSVSVLMSSFDIDRSTASAGLLLSNQTSPTISSPQWEGFTSRTAPDEIWIPLGFANGLACTSATTVFVPVRARIRPLGSTTWINLPEFHVVQKRQNGFAITLKFMWQSWDGIHVTVPDQGGPVRAWYTVPTQTNPTLTGTGGWQANSYFYSSGDLYLSSANATSTTGLVNMDCFEDRIEFYLGGTASPDLFPQTVAWEIQVLRGQANQNTNFTANATYMFTTGYVHDLFGYYLDGSSQARVYESAANFSDSIQIPRITSVWNDNPVPDQTSFATISVKVRDRSINELSVVASGYVYDWNGTTWSTLTTSSNPATNLHEVLTSSLGSTPLPSDVIDEDSILDWRTHCITNGYTCNAVIEGRNYFDVCTMICGTGYARLFHNEQWGVFLDKDRSAESPTQIFNPRNMKDFKWTKAFVRMPSGFRASYLDATNSYRNAESIIYSDADNPDVSRLESITYSGLTDAAQVLARGTFDLEQLTRRMTFYSGVIDLESLVCQRGDLVGVQHDILSTHGGFSVVKEVEFESNLVSGLTLDGTIPLIESDGLFSQTNIFNKDFFTFGATTGIAIRLKNSGGIVVKQLSSSSTNAEEDATSVIFATPFADPGSTYLAEGCLVSTGLYGSEYKRLLVHSIVTKQDLTASIIFVDEAPELWQ